jgi:hypothetical protein
MSVSSRVPKRIGVAAAHGRCELKHYLVKKLQETAYDVIDFGRLGLSEHYCSDSQSCIQ